MTHVKGGEGGWTRVCDGCGAEASDENSGGWLCINGIWAVFMSGHDTFHGDFCRRCTPRIAEIVFPLSNRIRDDRRLPRLFAEGS